jgi:hypothetical protein
MVVICVSSVGATRELTITATRLLLADAPAVLFTSLVP